MVQTVISERTKGFVSVSSHPVGCARFVDETIDRIGRVDFEAARPGPVVVVGASGGYGLPAAAIAAFGLQVPVVTVSYDRPAEGRRTATAGWYNMAQIHRRADAAGVSLTSINGDGFSDEVKKRVTDALHSLGPASLLIYSLAAPARTDPTSGITYRSTLKPVGEVFETKTIRIDSGEVRSATLTPATEEEIDATIKVMGGEDWERWIDALSADGLLGENFRTVAFDYIGPQITHPIYRSGTIGQAKAHLEATARRLDERLGTGGGAWASVNAAAVTQSSTAIPAVPLYLSLLLAVCEPEVFEDPTTQMIHLFREHLGSAGPTNLDANGRIRLDDWELAPDIQDEVMQRWDRVDSDSLPALADFDGFRDRFRGLFGFGRPDVDYGLPTELDLGWAADPCGGV